MKLSNEKNIKNILDYHTLEKKKIEKIRNHNAKKDLLFFSLSFSFLPSLAFTYVVIRYSILRERFCGFRYSLAVRSYLLFCAALGTWENDIKPPPKRALAVQRNTLSKSTLSRCPLRSKFKDLLTPLRAFIAQRFETVHIRIRLFFSLSFLSFFFSRSRALKFNDTLLLSMV